MEIRQLRAALRARNFDRTCHFYNEILGLSRVQTWETEELRGALFQAASALIEVIGRNHPPAGGGRDEAFDYQGPEQKLALVLEVPSAEKAYEELQFREKNIPGGLRKDADGTLLFETHDPDGVKIICRETAA
jgi:catechol 2,3-dioxygenase-like lactoylglutathione lyase family enzyme